MTVTQSPARHPRTPDRVDTLAKFQAPEVVFGPEALSEAGFVVRRLGGRTPLIVTDPGLHEAGWVDALLAVMRDVGLSPVVFSAVTPNPKDHEVSLAHAVYAEHECDVVVGLGGGSCMDAAKGVAILAGNGGDILSYRGIDRVREVIPPMLMIPTTSGTGADVSQFCIVTDTERRTKVTILGRALVPDVSLVDPLLLMTMPEWLGAATGLDALTHGVEAFVSRAHNPLADVHALHAVELVGTHLRHTLRTPADPERRTGMAQASLNAGLAFSNAILGATHAMSHQVGGLLDAPHGVINGVLLPHVIRYNAQSCPKRFVDLAVRLGLPATEAPAAEVAEQLADAVRVLGDDVGVPRGLAELGMTEADVAPLARSSLEDACLTTNPRAPDVADLESLFRAAL